jgi:G3E family GTPase
VGIEAEGQLSFPKAQRWLSDLLRERGADIFRSKGILCFEGSDDKWAAASCLAVLEG